MKLVTYVIDGSGEEYEMMLRVWQKTAHEHMPDLRQKVMRMSPPKKQVDLQVRMNAFHETLRWVIKQPEDCIITDADIMFLGDIRGVMARDFDIAITTREYKRVPKSRYNSGVVYFRATDKGRKFLKKWIKKLEDPKMVDGGYSGPNQAALARVLSANKKSESPAKVIELPCAIYNAEQSCWAELSPDVKVLHIKSRLRKACFLTIDDPPEHLVRIARKWRGYL